MVDHVFVLILVRHFDEAVGIHLLVRLLRIHIDLLRLLYEQSKESWPASWLCCGLWWVLL